MYLDFQQTDKKFVWENFDVILTTLRHEFGVTRKVQISLSLILNEFLTWSWKDMVRGFEQIDSH